ncbi:MAG: nucleotidyl transferase AbiEii/AbiGii toxin family protein [Clostridia bacterium]|nr:nucleotidyl transferase AbiEii/AbiGii toxin family protein [Clostridia bacterium]
MWKEMLTPNTQSVIENISKLECIKDFHLCGGTGIALQLKHRRSEDLDFELLSVQGKNEESKRLDHGRIIDELKSVFGSVENGEGVVTNNHFECFVGNHVKLSFFKPTYKVPVLNEVSILNNLKTVSLQDALGMKLYVITQRDKFRDYYDIYSILKEGYSLEDGIRYALSFSRHDISSNNIIQKILSKDFFDPSKKEGYFDFNELKAKYNVSSSQICDFIEEKLTRVQIKKIKVDTTINKSIGRLFYETFINVKANRLVRILDCFQEYKELQNGDAKINYLSGLLSSVGVNVAPYDFSNADFLELRKNKDVDSLKKVDEIISEYDLYNKLRLEIEQQNHAIKEAQEVKMEYSLKSILIENCNLKIDDLKNQLKDLRFFEEFESAEREKFKLKTKVETKKNCKKMDAILDSDLNLMRDNIKQKQEDSEKQKETNTRTIKRKR